MSYILDALNKAERERRLGQVPLLASAPTTVTRRRHRSGLAAGILLVLTAATLGWLALNWNVPGNPGTPPASQAGTPAAHPAAHVVVAQRPLSSRQPQAYAQLPATLRHKLGPLQLDITVFSAQPGQRFVVINDHRYRQGDWLRPGLLLERISADGATLDYQGRRFRLTVNP